ncbi:MAG: hypothetical protein ABI721_02045 [Candidatus Dojkabacteria bacterium]
MGYKQVKTKDGQVLLITLLVLTIIGIVVVGLVTLSNRDVTQVATSEKYEKLYNASETQVRKIIDNFGKYDKPLDTLPQTFSECQALQAGVSYKCTVQDSSLGSTNFKTDVDINNRKDVQNFEVLKDKSFVLNSTGYAASVDVSWDKTAAIEFTLVVQDASRNLRVIKDVYDLAGIYTGLAGDNPYNQPNAVHSINFQVSDPSNKPTTTRITLTPAGVNGLAASDNVLYISLTPRMTQVNGSVKFNVVAQNAASFPYQIREFVSTSIDTNDNTSPLAKVITQIPLAPQMDSAFDYALISNSAINSY